MNKHIIKAAIFDVDDTLLDNRTDHGTIHTETRYIAVQEIADKYNIKELKALTHEENREAFSNASTHSLPGALWQIFYEKGIVTTPEMDNQDTLLQEIVQKKNSLHADVLRKRGKEVPGAIDFVKKLHKNTHGKIAIASAAYRNDVDIFLDMMDITDLFDEGRIITIESITHTKPDPEPFEKAYTSLNLEKKNKQHTYAFEDDPKGIRSAKAAGLYTCAITTRFDRAHFLAQEVAPDLIADSFKEFEKILKI